MLAMLLDIFRKEERTLFWDILSRPLQDKSNK